ncbi:MAG: hypothetical protein QW482_03405 [Thermoproteota archaeon]
MYRLIYFFGPDGTGKTTHADLVASKLRQRGYKVWRASVKQHHTVAYLLLKIINADSYSRQTITYYGFNNELASKIRRIWKVVEFLGLFPALLNRVYLPLLLSHIVVCDRYVLDTIVTLSYFLKEPRLVSSIPARILLKLIPKKSLLVHFDADTEVIMLRKQDEPLTVELVSYYRRMYALVLNIYGLNVEKINTTDIPIEDVQEKINQLLSETLNGKINFNS